MKQVLYIDREDYRKIEEEERNKFVKNVLLAMDLPIEDIWPGLELSTEEKIALRQLLGKYKVLIAGHGRDVEIYVENELIAHWRQPRYRLMVDNSELDPSKKVFFEMTLDYSSVFDTEDEWTEEEEK